MPIFPGLFAVWLGSALPIAAGAPNSPLPNWTTADAACAKYDDLRKPVLGEIGVKIDAVGPWADAFRRALGFWNSVLAADFHEESNLGACAVRIVNGGPDLLNNAIVARAQLTERDNFRGKIAVSAGAAKAMSSSELYGAAVHEFGHILGLKHNASSRSIMYFLNINGTEVLDAEDLSNLSALHKLRRPRASTVSVSTKVALIAVPAP